MRDTRSDVIVLLRIFKEVDDFLQLFLFLIRACNVCKTDFDVLLRLCAGTTEVHVLVVLLGDGTEHDYAKADDKAHPQHGKDVIKPTCLVGVGCSVIQCGVCHRRVIGNRAAFFNQ